MRTVARTQTPETKSKKNYKMDKKKHKDKKKKHNQQFQRQKIMHVKLTVNQKKHRQQKRSTTAETARRKKQYKNCRIKMRKTNFVITKSKQNETNRGKA